MHLLDSLAFSTLMKSNHSCRWNDFYEREFWGFCYFHSKSSLATPSSSLQQHTDEGGVTALLSLFYSKLSLLDNITNRCAPRNDTCSRTTINSGWHWSLYRSWCIYPARHHWHQRLVWYHYQEHTQSLLWWPSMFLNQKGQTQSSCWLLTCLKGHSLLWPGEQEFSQCEWH